MDSWIVRFQDFVDKFLLFPAPPAVAGPHGILIKIHSQGQARMHPVHGCCGWQLQMIL